MRLPPLVVKRCAIKTCKRTWRAMKCSTWNFCSRTCAMEAGIVRKDQDFRDQVSLTFVETHEVKIKQRGY